MIKETLFFRKRRVQKTGNALYISIPCEVHEYWGLIQGTALELSLTSEGDILIKKPIIIRNQEVS